MTDDMSTNGQEETEAPKISPKDQLLELLKAEGMGQAEVMAVSTVKRAFSILPQIADIIPGEIDDYAIGMDFNTI